MQIFADEYEGCKIMLGLENTLNQDHIDHNNFFFNDSKIRNQMSKEYEKH